MFLEFFKRVCHWGPVSALTIITSITLCTLNVTATWLPPFVSLTNFLIHLLFLVLVLCVLTNFFSAMIDGPGYVPYGWKPVNEIECQYLQFCNLCKSYKAPRAHHCRKCNRCVMKMDHHCPWINSCCGHFNHSKFVSFLISAVLGCIQATVLLSISLYRALHLNWYFIHGDRSRVVYLSIYSLAFTIFCLGLSLGVIIAVGGLFYVQMKSILKNETGIENWIVTKALGRLRAEGDVFIYPYDLGYKTNLLQVFWYPMGNGIQWPVVDGCHQYTLTIEQLIQKQDKQARRRLYTIIEPYSGSWFPWSKGVKTCCSPPCSDEPRIGLGVGDCVYVTRWKRYWLYGEKWDDLLSSENGNKPVSKGWFPRCCAVEFISPECEIPSSTKKML